MKEYSNEISLIKNGRGVYCIDTIMGCSSGLAHTSGGCYGDCYAAQNAKRYGFDFSKSILRKFKNENHKRQILSNISKIKMPFIRIGCSGDPSENWEHTFDILKTLSKSNTEIVIITRHWNILTNEQLNYLSTIRVCINTSVSALDEVNVLYHSLEQFNRLKPFCKSVLRIVSCDFNLNNETGARLSITQDMLFENKPVIDTVFRPSKNNPFVTHGIINVREEVFNGGKCLASKRNRKTYMGNCSRCKEMCGQSFDFSYKRKLIKQLEIFCLTN